MFAFFVARFPAGFSPANGSPTVIGRAFSNLLDKGCVADFAGSHARYTCGRCCSNSNRIAHSRKALGGTNPMLGWPKALASL